MRILSMTATFGKLEHQTLSLQPGLNVICAPNEWGKSTWCAFLTAMLYGIDTRERTTQTTLADKERFAPWSGEPMSGRMDLLWNGRAVTIERRTKGRSIFGDFKAYETDTGLPVPELTATNCGEVLLGVEKSVFTRAGFIKLTDLPVAQDDALRRRLNALVTTGDESGASDALEKKLRDLKNRCRFNKTGLLPQAEAQRTELQQTLSRLQLLQEQQQRSREELAALDQHILALENHQVALRYAQHHTHQEKLAAARTAEENAARQLDAAQNACAQLPSREHAEQTLSRLRQLRDRQDSLHTRARLLPTAPLPPETPVYFQGLSAQSAVAQAQADKDSYTESNWKAARQLRGILSLLLAIAGITGLLIPHWIGKAAGIAAVVAGLLLLFLHTAARRRAQTAARTLLEKYAPIPPQQWEQAAQAYAAAQAEYTQALARYHGEQQTLDADLSELNRQLRELTRDRSLSDCEEHYLQICRQYDSLDRAMQAHLRAQEISHALSSGVGDVQPPRFPDTLTHTPEQTRQQLSAATEKRQQLQLRLGQLQGQMDGCDSEETLLHALSATEKRIRQLEDTYAALTIALQTLTQAANALQRRFAPQISRRAQELFGKLTENRYDRLSLGADLSLSAGAQGEDTLHSTLWRSDGTADQLYLALRLAVAEALTPQAPLILDDALVRFDDRRLAAAMALLQETAQEKQILLFSCQSREQQFLS